MPADIPEFDPALAAAAGADADALACRGSRAGASAPARVRVRVWDLPTRLFHWALAASVTGALVTGEIGDPWMAWHFRCGETAGALLLFRLAWGLAGGRWSRFASFPPTPGRLLRHWRGTPHPADHPGVGHSPPASLSVWAMLLVLAAQVGAGLFADDEISTTGPLSHLAGSAAVDRLTHWHTGWGLDLVFGLLGLHVAAIAWHAWRRHEPLLPAMWHGDKMLPAGTPDSRDGAGPRLLAAVLAAAAFGGVFGAIVRFGA